MKLTTRQLTLCAVLTAMALALSYLENFFPLSLAIPIPGIKLGLANIVTLFALYALGPGQALLILLARCLLGAVFAGKADARLSLWRTAQRRGSLRPGQARRFARLAGRNRGEPAVFSFSANSRSRSSRWRGRRQSRSPSADRQDFRPSP